MRIFLSSENNKRKEDNYFLETTAINRPFTCSIFQSIESPGNSPKVSPIDSGIVVFREVDFFLFSWTLLSNSRGTINKLSNRVFRRHLILLGNTLPIMLGNFKFSENLIFGR